jgi:hypothetical protein
MLYCKRVWYIDMLYRKICVHVIIRLMRVAGEAAAPEVRRMLDIVEQGHTCMINAYKYIYIYI